jgi:hypothetical protein
VGQGAGRGIRAAPSWVRRFFASGPSTGVVHVTLPRTMGEVVVVPTATVDTAGGVGN